MRRAGLPLVLAAALLAGVASAAGRDAPLLWEVAGAKATHYLLGSVHMLPPQAHPLPPVLQDAYAATRAVVFESDLGVLASEDVQARLLGAAKENREGGIKAQIGDKLYQKLQARAKGLGLPTPVCETFRAWFCALTLELFAMQQAGFVVEYGVDQHFYARAREDGRSIGALEPPERQLAMFVDMPDKLSTRFLAATLDEATEAGQAPEDLHRIWRSGDLAALDRVVATLRRKYPDVHEWLLAQRNRDWLPALAERLTAAEPQLVVVGAAHLPGPDGLLALLKSRGFDARRVDAVAAAPVSPE